MLVLLLAVFMVFLYDANKHLNNKDKSCIQNRFPTP